MAPAYLSVVVTEGVEERLVGERPAVTELNGGGGGGGSLHALHLWNRGWGVTKRKRGTTHSTGAGKSPCLCSYAANCIYIYIYITC